MWEWLNRWFLRDKPPELGQDLRESLKSLERQLERSGIHHALIGGLGLVAHGLPRATSDIDYYVSGEHEDALHGLLTELGFETLQRTENVSSYLLGRLRVDVLYARREYGVRMLADAQSVTLDGTQLRALRLEDIIGLKLQALRSNPSRTQDLADIERAVREKRLEMDRIRRYARVLEMEALLDELVRRVESQRNEGRS